MAMVAKLRKREAPVVGIAIRTGLISLILSLLAAIAAADGPCITADRVQALRSAIGSDSNSAPDVALRDEILGLRKHITDQVLSLSNDRTKTDQQRAEASRKVTERICAILNSKNWPAKSVVGPEASSAWINLIKTFLDPQTQRDVIPVIQTGIDRSEIDRDGELASFIDRLRVRSGQTQLFGTQASVSNGFLVLWPLQSEGKTDEWRKAFGLEPLRDYMLGLQIIYKMPIIRSTARAARVDISSAASEKKASELELLDGAEQDADVVRVDTSIVKIDATVYDVSLSSLRKEDFRVYEDGQLQEISTFAAPDAPFDIVLLLDLSGSTEGMIGLIKKTTRRFIEMKRDGDRVAIVTFSGTQTVVSDLERDKKVLLERVSEIRDTGSSSVWDAEKFAIDLLNREPDNSRRKAIVVMTDGADNALLYARGWGSKTLFADLVEKVRNSSVAFFPIYLDTEGKGGASERVYADARRTLELLADESGGNYYTAKDLGKLESVYSRVMQDVGRVYSIGYEPRNPRRDGRWRAIRVEIVNHPESRVRARPGYYAK